MKIEPGEHNSVDKQIIASKESIRLSDNEAKKSWDSKILLALISLVLCMTFSFMIGKTLQR